MLKYIILASTFIALAVIIPIRLELFRESENDVFQVLNRFLLGNEIECNVGAGIELHDIKLNLYKSDICVFMNGKYLGNIGEYYGGPIFDVYYKNQLIGRALHDNTNDWYVGKYVFFFFKQDGEIKFSYKSYAKNKSGDEGYIWINYLNDSIEYKCFEPGVIQAHTWKEAKIYN